LLTAKKAFSHNIEADAVAEQKESSILRGDLEKMRARPTHCDNKAEHTYPLLQVLTATTASFAHGANDASNYSFPLTILQPSYQLSPRAIGTLAAIYLIWHTGKPSSKSPVPMWVL